MFKRTIVALLLLLLFHSANSQDSKNKSLVSVTLDLVGKGAPTTCARADTSDFYFATVNVLNTQGTTITLWVMSCSWPMDGFVINNEYRDSIAFTFCYWGCDSNIPEEIILPPKKAVRFYGTIKSWKKDSSIPRIKVGFRVFQTFGECFFTDNSREKEKLQTIVWSNEVELKDNLYRYEIK